MMDQRLSDRMLIRSFQGEDPKRPRIICLCGSTRFYEAFQVANYVLTMEGDIVLTVGFYPHSTEEAGHGEGVGHDSEQKVQLDELHKRKIDLCDEVVVLNVDGYIGSSTLSEIDYAINVAHKTVTFLEQGQRWGGVKVGTIVPGSGTITAVNPAGEGRVYVTFDRTGHPGAIPNEAPGWFEGCNTWSVGHRSTDQVPVGMSRNGNGFLCARRALSLQSVAEMLEGAMKPPRITGHTLRSEGAPFKLTPYFEGTRPERANWTGVSGDGMAVCSCGEMSVPLTSGAERRRWHAEHKKAIQERSTR